MACGRGGGSAPSAQRETAGEGREGAAAAVAATKSKSSKNRTPAAAEPTVAPEQVCLVSKERGLSAGYVPPDLTLLPARVRAVEGVQLRQVAAVAVVELIDGARTDGHELFVLSGFRSYADQERVLKQEIALVGRQTAEKQVAPPGHSEHQLGLAVDITSKRSPYELRRQFGQEPEGKWLAGFAARFGFVISYPEGKEDVTGYTYEPWHIRYVGAVVAEQVIASGLTLSEYLPTHGMAGGCP
jgi:D-alanyl-D-alanine carboxypeptidase